MTQKGILMQCIKALVTASLVIFSTAFNSHAQSTLADGLVAYYQMNGTANDSSGNGNNGQILNGNFTTDRFGNSLSAFQRPTPQVGWDWGIDTKITDTLATSLTLALWFKVPSTASGLLITYGIPGYVDPYISVEQGRLTFRVSAPQNWLDYHDSSVADDNWHSVVATISGSADCLYFDGNLVLAGNNPTPSSSGTWKLGTIVGDIDDVRIYNRALSATEVQQLYQVESVPEPCSIALIGIGFASFVAFRRRWMPGQ